MRLVTRADLDGLACALVLRRYEPIDEVLLVSAQDITDKAVEIRSDDVIANLPYHPACGAWFDHHLLTDSNEKPPPDFSGAYRLAPSAAEIIWEHYGKDPDLERLVAETSRLDSAQLSQADVLQPQGYILLGFTLDPRTGFTDHEAYFHQCLEWLEKESIERVLVRSEVRQRILRMFAENEDFCWNVMHCSQSLGNVVFTDFRRIEEPPVGNRFLVYTLFPEANVSVQAQWGRDQRNVMVRVGHSIFNRSCSTSIGELMSDYGGGGHAGAGSAPLPLLQADLKIFQIIERLQEAPAPA